MNTKLTVLLKDFGYKVTGCDLIEMAWRGGPARTIRQCRGLFDAAEQLIPLLRDDEFYSRFCKITNQ